MIAHCSLKQNMCLCSKQSGLFSFYALPSGGKLKDAVVHYVIALITVVIEGRLLRQCKPSIVVRYGVVAVNRKIRPI